MHVEEFNGSLAKVVIILPTLHLRMIFTEPALNIRDNLQEKESRGKGRKEEERGLTKESD